MPRVKKKKPLRASVTQNTSNWRDEDEVSSWFGFGARLALLILGAITIIAFAAWLWRSDWPERQARRFEHATLSLTRSLGFRVEDVMVEGRHFTDKGALLATLGVAEGSPIFAFDPEETKNKIEQLPWTSRVSVIRSLPDKIVVRLVERQPIARWQHDDRTVVIDEDGKELTAAKPEQFANLPLVVGNAAPAQTQVLLGLLHDFPVVARVLKAAVRVGERRWNFFIHPNLLIRLPEHKVETALTQLTQLIQEQKVLERNIVAIDLRLPERMVIEPGNQPAAPQYGDTRE